MATSNHRDRTTNGPDAKLANLEIYDAIKEKHLVKLIDLHQNKKHRPNFNEPFGPEVRDDNNWGVYPLHLACKFGHLEIVRFLLNINCDVNAKTTFLHRSPLNYTVRKGHMACFQVILDAGASIDDRDVTGNTCCHYAATNGHCRMIDILIGRGANVDIRDVRFKTPLMKAIVHGYLDVVNKFIKAGCQVDAQNTEGDTALHIAVRLGEIKILDRVLKTGTDADPINRSGYTPLMDAIIYGQTEAACMLIEAGCDLNKQEPKGGNTVLHMAAIRGNDVMVKILMEAGCRQDIFNNDGESAAYYPVYRNEVDMVKILAKCNYDLDIPAISKTGFEVPEISLYQIAVERNHWEICWLLREVNCGYSFTPPSGEVTNNTGNHGNVHGFNTSLKQLCRKSIRNALGYKLASVTDGLPLPKVLKEYILLKDIIP
jgi:ankyrin repeat protein